ncbi:hypothetical protein F4779DRAFT_7444 [Xylariaceae sp. FL0662B]|nr:hypothetical protein F4779DRAFT_7444 [Xylariaceae sp. FL0662B]
MRPLNVFFSLSSLFLIGATCAPTAQGGRPPNPEDYHPVAKRWTGRMTLKQAQWIISLAIQQNEGVAYDEAVRRSYRGFGRQAVDLNRAYRENYWMGVFPDGRDIGRAQEVVFKNS